MTTKLRNGVEVEAKAYKGQAFAKTYANRTQAERACTVLGAGWAVYRGMGRPFYAAKIESMRQHGGKHE